MVKSKHKGKRMRVARNVRVILACLGAALLAPTAYAQTYTKTEVIAYHDNPTKWVLGQVESIRCLSAVPASTACNGNDYSVEATYNSNALPETLSSFDKVQQILTYHADGSPHTIKDGRNYATTLSDWHRGIPETIQYPNTSDQPSGASKSAVVDDNGWVKQVTDENSYVTKYDHDEMGRLTFIDFPDGDQVNWTSTTRNFSVQAGKFGLPNHWRLLVRTANGYQITRYDALWRPVIEETYDNSNADGTRSLVVKRYDLNGRLAFQSYPLRDTTNLDFNDVTAGIYTEYDALGRSTLVRETSELGNLDTTTQYLAGFKTRLTLPKHQGASPAVFTETSYMAWDNPTTDLPVLVKQPEGVQSAIERDAMGKPLAVTRGSLTRSYQYNVHHELCRSAEPETGDTLYGYDGAGNLSWSAPGQPAGSACVDGTAPPASALERASRRTYDARNRLKTLRFYDTRGDQDWYYTPDSLPARVVTVNVPGAVHPENQYGYNKRRQLITETQYLPSWYSYSIGYSYDTNGHLKRIHYPSSDYVDFAPNSLGQPTRAEGYGGRLYASNVTYHADGSIAGFHYGNGVAYTMEQFAQRPMPKRVDSYGVQKYEYKYDANGNPDTIFDQTRGNSYSRLLRYDNLDRLTSVGSASFGGSEHWQRFTYDALDNLVTWKHAGVRDSRYCYDTSNRLQFLRSGATSCSNGAATDYFQYDPQGNVEIHDETAFDFDFGNRLREVIDVERYRYDAYGRRMLAVNFATGILFSQYGQSGRLLYQKNNRTGENKQIDHIYLGGSLIAQREQPLTPANAPVVVKYIHTDALGSPVAVTDDAIPANVVERMDYDPYGGQRASTATVGRDRPGYTGHVLDQASGLNYMQQRYYDPQIGRFLSADPVTVDSGTGGNFNRYWYADNNPYAFIDPDGRKTCPHEGLGGCTETSQTESGSTEQNSQSSSANSKDSTPTLATVMVVAQRVGPGAGGGSSVAPWGAGISRAVGGMLSFARAPFLFLYSPHPCGGELCGELTMESKKYNPGFWPGDKGAEEWGRRNGVGAAEGRRRFHGIKQGDKGQGGGKGQDDYGTNPNTGEVQNPQGETVGDLNGG